MTGHQTVEKFAKRPGFRLIDYIEVAFPVYAVTITTSTILRKRISPLQEFVMRCLEADVSSAGEVAQLLGLSDRVVDSVLATLVQQNDVALAGQEGKGNQVLKLTAKGQHTLTVALTIIPESKTFPLHFDGIIGTADVVRGTLLKFRDLREHGLKEMPVIPNRRPDVSEFPLTRLQEILRLGEATGDKRELLSVKRIERATRLFRPGVALLFRALDDSASVVDFIVDDKLRPDYAEAIDRNGGPPAFGLGADSALPKLPSTEVSFDAPPSGGV